MDRLSRLLTSRKGVVCVLFGTWLVHLVFNAAFLSEDRAPAAFPDAVGHLQRVYHVVAGLKRVGLGALLEEAGSTTVEWPPLVPLTGGLLAYGVDASFPAVRLYNMVFVGLLLIGVYWVGHRRAGPGAGLLAAVCCSFMPAVYSASREFGLDFPATALVALTVAALIATDGLSTARASLVAGACCGLAVLGRGQSVLFFGGIALWQLARGLRRQPRLRAVTNAALCVAAAAVVSAIWWWGKIPAIAEVFLNHGDPERIPRAGEPGLLGGAKLYLGGLPSLTSWPVLLVTLPAAFQLFRVRHPARWDLAIWLLVPLTALHLLAIRHLRYMLPLLPVLPLAAAIGIMSIQRATVRRVGALVLLLSAVGPFAICAAICCGGGKAERMLCGSMSRPPGQAAMYRETARVAPLLRARISDGQPALLLLAIPLDAPLVVMEAGLHLASRCPGLVVYHVHEYSAPWRRHVAGHARHRFLLAREGYPLAPDARELVATLHGEHATLVLWQLAPSSRWLPR